MRALSEFGRVLLAVCLVAASAEAATVRGVVLDATGGALAGARVALKDLATGRELVAETGADGRFEISTVSAGRHLLVASRRGFSNAARTIVISNADERLDAEMRLELGGLSDEVSVTAARADREIRQIPLHIETLSSAAILQSNSLSSGDALAMAANVTQVGGGPFGVRPRLRGLDSTRLLVLVDGERLNTARQATDRTGAEVGLIVPETIGRMEIVNGAGTLMYGSDALAGTINVVTNEPIFSSRPQFQYGLNTFYSSNENSGRGALSFGFTNPRFALRVQGGAERFSNYDAGKPSTEDTASLFADGTLRRADTIDDNFGFSFKAFPDPFNAPFVRTSREIPNSGARGNFLNATARVGLDDRQSFRVRYQQRRMRDIGFPDFADPYFFNATSLPRSDFDRASGKYEVKGVSSRLASLSATAYYQRTKRLLANDLPVQFPAPTPVTFFPVTVMRLDIHSETEQRVWTSGVDLQAIWTPFRGHLLTTGATTYRDKSSDARTTATTTSMVGQVILGSRGPASVVFPSRIVLGPASIAHPVRVPDATFTNTALFAQDEWRIHRQVSLVAGLRGDLYRVTTKATPGYDVSSIIAGANPAINPATLPTPTGDSYSRNALTGDVGATFNPQGRLSGFIRYGRSFRHPNLEELLFSGPATIGNIAPNVLVKPETGRNFDVGTKFRAGGISGGVYGFLNAYRNFIAQDLVVASTPAGPLAQATNYANVRIGGVELSVDAPFVTRPGVVTVSGAVAFMRGTITKGENPLLSASLDGTPADNITPSKFVFATRFTNRNGKWWAEYGARTQGRVERVAQALLDSPFLVAQDLLSLDSLTIQRIGAGIDLSRQRDRIALTLALENLTNRFYREQFQFAPARGRTFTVGLTIGAF